MDSGWGSFMRFKMYEEATSEIVQALGCISTNDKMTSDIVDSAHFVRALNRAVDSYKWGRK